MLQVRQFTSQTLYMPKGKRLPLCSYLMRVLWLHYPSAQIKEQLYVKHKWELAGLDFSLLLMHCCRINLNVLAVQEAELCPGTRFFWKMPHWFSLKHNGSMTTLFRKWLVLSWESTSYSWKEIYFKMVRSWWLPSTRPC